MAENVIHKLTGHAAVRCQCVYCIGSRDDLAEYAGELELQLAAATDVAVDSAGTDAMRLLEAIATIIDGPIADTRLHDWSGLPERVRLTVQGWLPIVTAPKDEEVLVSDTAQQVWSAIQRQDATWISADGNQLFVAFTHWMPLPAPPDVEETR
jgi:hypothetical protein